MLADIGRPEVTNHHLATINKSGNAKHAAFPIIAFFALDRVSPSNRRRYSRAQTITPLVMCGGT
jgi:hypothetical protein